MMTWRITATAVQSVTKGMEDSTGVSVRVYYTVMKDLVTTVA